MRNKLITLLMGGFFVLMVSAIVQVDANRPRALILHSYQTDYVWTRELNVGLRRELDKQSWIQLRYHYMNTKKKSDAAYLRRAGIAARKAVEDMRPDVIIAFDDYAQKLVGSKFVNHPKIKIVFAGINGSIEPYGYDKANNVTGILERKPVAALKEAMVLLGAAIGKNTGSGQMITAALVADTTLSAARDAEYIAQYDWKPIDYKGAQVAKDFEEWKKLILETAREVDFIMVGGYRKLKRRPDSPLKEGFVPPREVMKWTEANSPVPIIGLNVFNTEDGAMLSVGV